MGSPATWLRPIASIGLLIPALLVLPGLLAASGTPDQTGSTARAAQHYTHVKAHLSKEARYGGLLGLPVAGWKQVALSNMAAGLMSMAVDARQDGDNQKLAELGGWRFVVMVVMVLSGGVRLLLRLTSTGSLPWPRRAAQGILSFVMTSG